jgi:hypothetical protein
MKRKSISDPKSKFANVSRTLREERPTQKNFKEPPRKIARRASMSYSNTIAQMTRSEFREMLGTLIEEKLTEILVDPDEGLEFKASFRNRLLKQKKAVARGERGELFDDVIKRLGLAH